MRIETVLTSMVHRAIPGSGKYIVFRSWGGRRVAVGSVLRFDPAALWTVASLTCVAPDMAAGRRIPSLLQTQNTARRQWFRGVEFRKPLKQREKQKLLYAGKRGPNLPVKGSQSGVAKSDLAGSFVVSEGI